MMRWGWQLTGSPSPYAARGGRGIHKLWFSCQNISFSFVDRHQICNQLRWDTLSSKWFTLFVSDWAFLFINKFCIGSWFFIRISRLTRLWIELKRSEIYPCWEFLPLNHFEQRRLVSQPIALFVSICRSMICIQLIFVALNSCNLWGDWINWSEIVFQSANHCHLDTKLITWY